MKEYTIKEAADLLDLSTSTIRRRIKSNKIEAEKKETKFGPKYFIPAEEINIATTKENVVDVKNINRPLPAEDFKETSSCKNDKSRLSTFSSMISNSSNLLNASSNPANISSTV